MRKVGWVLRALLQVWVGWLGGALQAVFVEAGDILGLGAALLKSAGMSVWTSFAILHFALDPSNTAPQAKAAVPEWLQKAFAKPVDDARLPQEPPTVG